MGQSSGLSRISDFSKGQMDWAVVYFDKPLSKEQRDGIATIVGHLFPVKWNSLTTAEATIDHWEFNKDTAYASMDGGKTAEVKLKRIPGNTNQPVVIQNLKYWGAPRNDGFVLMPNEVEAYRVEGRKHSNSELERFHDHSRHQFERCRQSEHVGWTEEAFYSRVAGAWFPRRPTTVPARLNLEISKYQPAFATCGFVG